MPQAVIDLFQCPYDFRAVGSVPMSGGIDVGKVEGDEVRAVLRGHVQKAQYLPDLFPVGHVMVVGLPVGWS